MRVRYHRADSIDDAHAQLLKYGDDARIVNGGTAMAILMRQHLVQPAVLVGVDRITALRATSVASDGTISIGAAVRLRTLERDARILTAWPMIAEAIRSVATPRIRNMATLGGGLAHADPAQDPPVALSAAGAIIVIRGLRERRIDAGHFCIGYYENVLKLGEIVTGIELPPQAPRSGGAYLKFLPRSAEDYGVVTAAAQVKLDEDGRCTGARLALGAVADRPVIIDVASALTGARITEATANEAAQRARSIVDPLPDVRGSAGYKREMAVVFARRALLVAARRASAS